MGAPAARSWGLNPAGALRQPQMIDVQPVRRPSSVRLMPQSTTMPGQVLTQLARTMPACTHRNPTSQIARPTWPAQILVKHAHRCGAACPSSKLRAIGRPTIWTAHHSAFNPYQIHGRCFLQQAHDAKLGVAEGVTAAMALGQPANIENG